MRLVARLLVITFILQAQTISSAELRRPSVLFIASYHASFPTFKYHYSGIQNTLKASDYKLDIEFLDAKRFPDHSQVTAQLLTYKLNRLPKYQLILTADDAATRFAFEHRNSRFANIPIIFFGVNNAKFAHHISQQPQITGIIEAVPMTDTIELARTLYGADSRITVISDATETGLASTQQFIEAAQALGHDHYQLLSLGDLSYKELNEQISNIRLPGTIILLSAFQDRLHRPQEFDQTIQQLRAVSQVPLLHMWYHGLGDGVFGGKMISHKHQAKTAAKIAKQVLSGKEPNEFPVIEEASNRYMFDYHEVTRFGFSQYQLPENSIFINLPEKQGFSAQDIFLISTICSIILLIIVIVQAVRIQMRKAKEFDLVEIQNALKSTAEERALELMSTRQQTESLLKFKNSLLNSGLISVFLIKGRSVEWINNYAEKMLGYDNESCRHRDADMFFFNKSDYQRLLAESSKTLAQGENYQTELPFRHRDGTQLWCLVSAKALNPNDLSEGVVYIVVDISDRKRMEDQLKNLNAQLESQAITDELTGISNRRRMTQLLEQESHRANRYHYGFSIILLDLDHFKTVNDNFGHDVGDKVLRQVARLLQNTCRQVDTSARWGGEEFVVLCPHTDLNDAVTLAELLRGRLEAMRLQDVPQITGSFGVACYRPGHSLDELLKAADVALYQAKESRNKVCFQMLSKLAPVEKTPLSIGQREKNP